MEEKNGRIVEFVESTEVQKQQKKAKRQLRIMVASLILTGAIGYGVMNQSQAVEPRQEAISTLTDMGMSEVEAVEKIRAAEEKAAQERGVVAPEQAYIANEHQQFLDKINQKIVEMNQMLDNIDVNEQTVSEGKTR